MSTSRILTEKEDVVHWLVHGKPGSRIIYFTGFLGPSAPNAVRGLAALLYHASTQGKVHLLQRRIAKGKFEYIAEKRSIERERFGWNFNPTRVRNPGQFRVPITVNKGS